MPYMSLILVVVMIAALIDIICSDEAVVRGLPRWGWLLLVVLLPLIGSLIWFVAGRPLAANTRSAGRYGTSRPGQASAMGYPEYDQPGRFVPTNPEADAAFLAQVRARAEQQRRQGEAERRRRENGA